MSRKPTIGSVGSRIASLKQQGWRVPAALAATYLFFGSGPAAVKAAIISLPPLGLVAARGLIAGALLLTWALISGSKLPSMRQWIASFIVGVLILALGTGCGSLGQRTVASGIVGVLSALLPLLAACLGYVLFRETLPRRAVIGLVLGFIGVGLLLRPGSGIDWFGILLVVAGQVAWSFAAVLAPRLNLPEDPKLAAGAELLCGGAVLLVAAALLGDFNRLDLASVAPQSWIGFGSFVVIAVVGFTAYGYLATHVSCSVATSFSYVNPVMALFLGWLLYGEPLSLPMLLAVAVTVSGVCLIVSTRGQETCSTQHPLTSGRGHVYLVRGPGRPMLVLDSPQSLARLEQR